MDNSNKLFAVVAWLQLIIGVLLATAVMWGKLSSIKRPDDGMGI